MYFNLFLRKWLFFYSGVQENPYKLFTAVIRCYRKAGLFQLNKYISQNPKPKIAARACSVWTIRTFSCISDVHRCSTFAFSNEHFTLGQPGMSLRIKYYTCIRWGRIKSTFASSSPVILVPIRETFRLIVV